VEDREVLMLESLSERLSTDSDLLSDLLGQTIVEQAGLRIFDIAEQLPHLAEERRATGDTALSRRLTGLALSLDVETARLVLKCCAGYFQLINTAEDNHRVRVLHEQARRDFPQLVAESIGETLVWLKAQGVTADGVGDLLGRLSVDRQVCRGNRRSANSDSTPCSSSPHSVVHGPPSPEHKIAHARGKRPK
jgi:phosphoenolpyruvate carboxylase